MCASTWQLSKKQKALALVHAHARVCVDNVCTIKALICSHLHLARFILIDETDWEAITSIYTPQKRIEITADGSDDNNSFSWCVWMGRHSPLLHARSGFALSPFLLTPGIQPSSLEIPPPLTNHHNMLLCGPVLLLFAVALWRHAKLVARSESSLKSRLAFTTRRWVDP